MKGGEYDQERQTFIESFGIKIVRFLNSDIYENLDGVLEAIEREILDRRTIGASTARPPLAISPQPDAVPSSSPPYEGGAGGVIWIHRRRVDQRACGMNPPEPPLPKGAESRL